MLKVKNYSIKSQLMLSLKEYVATFISSILHKYSGNVIGHILVTVRESSFHRILGDKAMDKNEKIYLIDSTGQLFYNSDRLYGQEAGIAGIIRQDNITLSSGYYTDYQGERQMLITYVTLPQHGWKLVSMIPVSELRRQLDYMSVVIFAVIFFCISTSIVIAKLLYKGITKPLDDFVVRMKSIGSGDFTVDEYNIKTNNEIQKIYNNFNWMSKRIAQLMEKNIQIEAQKRDAELKALQSQINPHFLYNTLDTINWLAMLNNQDEIGKMVTNLSLFFRNGLNNGRDIIIIEEEIKHVKAFLEIERFRYNNRFDVIYNLDKRLLHFYTIKLILQPFVENALVHGFGRKQGAGRIFIQLFSKQDIIYFEIIDDGEGMTEEKINKVMKEKSEGYGINNVDERIKIKYGNAFGVHIESEVGRGTKVTVSIPKIEKNI